MRRCVLNERIIHKLRACAPAYQRVTRSVRRGFVSKKRMTKIERSKTWRLSFKRIIYRQKARLCNTKNNLHKKCTVKPRISLLYNMNYSIHFIQIYRACIRIRLQYYLKCFHHLGRCLCIHWTLRRIKNCKYSGTSGSHKHLSVCDNNEGTPTGHRTPLYRHYIPTLSNVRISFLSFNPLDVSRYWSL